MCFASYLRTTHHHEETDGPSQFALAHHHLVPLSIANSSERSDMACVSHGWRMSCRCRGCHELHVPLASQECHRCHGSLWCRGLQVHVGAEDSQDAGLLQIVGVRGPRNVDFLIAAWSGAYCNWPVQKKQVKKLAALADEGLELTAQLGATRARRGRC